MKLFIFWLLGVPASVGLLFAGFSPERELPERGPAHVRAADAAQHCYGEAVIVPSLYESRVACSPQQAE